MINLLTPELFNRLLCVGLGAVGASFVILSQRQPRHQSSYNWPQRPGLNPSISREWHLSSEGASMARKTANEVMDYWKQYYGIMSDLQAVTFAVTILSHSNVHGWSGGLDSVRRNIMTLALQVTHSNQRDPGRNGAGGAP